MPRSLSSGGSADRTKHSSASCISIVTISVVVLGTALLLSSSAPTPRQIVLPTTDAAGKIATPEATAANTGHAPSNSGLPLPELLLKEQADAQHAKAEAQRELDEAVQAHKAVQIAKLEVAAREVNPHDTRSMNLKIEVLRQAEKDLEKETREAAQAQLLEQKEQEEAQNLLLLSHKMDESILGLHHLGTARQLQLQLSLPLSGFGTKLMMALVTSILTALPSSGIRVVNHFLRLLDNARTQASALTTCGSFAASHPYLHPHWQVILIGVILLALGVVGYGVYQEDANPDPARVDLWTSFLGFCVGNVEDLALGFSIFIVCLIRNPVIRIAFESIALVGISVVSAFGTFPTFGLFCDVIQQFRIGIGLGLIVRLVSLVVWFIRARCFRVETTGAGQQVKKLQTGDMLLTSCITDFGAIVLQYISKSAWGHVAMVLRSPPEPLLVSFAVSLWLQKKFKGADDQIQNLKNKPIRRRHLALLQKRHIIIQQLKEKLALSQSNLETVEGRAKAALFISEIVLHILEAEDEGLGPEDRRLTHELLTRKDGFELCCLRKMFPRYKCTKKAGVYMENLKMKAAESIDPTEDLFVLEAVSTGVRLVPFELWMPYWYHQRQERVVLRKLEYTPSARTFSRTPSAQSVELEKHQSAIFEAAGDAVGKPYTDTQTFICAPLKAMLQQIGLMAKDGNASDQVLAGQHMCASLVAKVYQRCELLKPPFKDPASYLPRVFNDKESEDSVDLDLHPGPFRFTNAKDLSIP